AADAAQVVDLVVHAVALTGREPRLLGVVPALDIDRVGRAGPGAQLAADALLQPVRVPVELVPPVVAGRGRGADLRVLLGDDLLEHRREGDPETLERVEHQSFSLSSCAAEAATPARSRLGRALTPLRLGGFGTSRSSGGIG